MGELRDKKNKNYKSINPGFLYIIRLDKIVVPTWGKVGFCYSLPPTAIKSAKRWYPRPELIWTYKAKKWMESQIMEIMEKDLGCRFFDCRHQHEIFECADFTRLVSKLSSIMYRLWPVDEML